MSITSSTPELTPRSLTFVGSQGNRLEADGWGPADGRPILLMHGGGQTRHAWGGTAEALALDGYNVTSLDLRGHGDSEWAPDGDYSHDSLRDDVLRVIDELSGPPAIVGASLGGIAGLLAAGETGPGTVTALVLVDIAPRMEPRGVLRIRQFMTGYPDGFASLDEAADAIAGYRPERPRPKDVSGLEKNLRRGTDGRWRWHWDPRFVSRSDEVTDPATVTATAMYRRMKSAAETVDVPTLLVRGKLSDILSEEGAAEFRELVPHAEYVDVRDAGHMVAGDRNDVFTLAVTAFLERVLPS